MGRLTQKRLKEILEYDPISGVFTWKSPTSNRVKVGEEAGHRNKALGYTLIKLDGRLYYAHRLVWLYVYGEFPKGEIDHKNRDRSDNRLENLQELTKLDNASNRTPHGKTSKFYGVCYRKLDGKWIAQSGGWLGSFTCEKEAALRVNYELIKRKHNTHFNIVFDDIIVGESD